MASKVVLQIENPDGGLQQVSFAKEQVLVGRGPRCDLKLDHTERCAVSREHLMLELADDECFVVDRNSLNGTWIDWRQLTPGVRRKVEPGTRLRLGDFYLRVLSIEPRVEGDWSIDHAQVVCHDAALAGSLGEHVLVGRFFAFLTPGFASHEALRPLIEPAVRGEEAERAVVPLVGRGTVRLPGATLRAELPPFDLSCLTSDRRVYRLDHDTVRLLVVDLLRPGRTVRVEVRSQGALVSTHRVELGPGGLALLELPGLPAGRYEARLDAPGHFELACSFVVAGYRLAPLVARLVEHHIDAGRHLSFWLGVGCFGVPLEGEVAVELIEEDKPVAEARATAVGGELRGGFTLQGQGPFSLNVRSLADPDETATVPLPGSRSHERSEAVFSSLGAEVRGSRVPSPGARPVRGLFLKDGPAKPAPFGLELSDDGLATLVARKEARALWVVRASPRAAAPGGSGEPEAAMRCDHHERLAAGERLEIALGAPLSLLLLGAFVEGAPGEWLAWEGCALAVSPAQLGVSLVVDEQALAQGLLSVEVLTQKRDAQGHVFLLVKDARLGQPDTPEGGLASQIKRCAEQMVPRGVGYVRAASSLASLVPRPGRAPEGSEDEAFYCMTPYRRRAEAPPESAGASKDVLCASVLELKGGAARARVELGPAPREIEVRAFVVAGLDWEERSAQVRAEKSLFASLELPPFVARGEAAVGRVRVREGSAIELRRDGEPLELLPVEGPAGRPIEGFQFAATPGRYRATAHDTATGAQAHDEGEVLELGTRRQVIQTLRYLPEGERLDVSDDPSVLGVRVLPSFAAPLRALVDATRALGQGNCEQIAAGVVAACAACLIEADPRKREAAQAALLGGLRRLEGLWVEGEGFRLYPAPHGVDPQLSVMAARHLAGLDVLAQGEGGLPPEGRSLLLATLRRASDALRAQGLSPLPTEPATCEGIYRALRGGARGLTEADARRALALAAGEALARADAVARRAEKAYAAAALLRAGLPETLGAAIGLANEVIGDLGPHSRFYSTVDSVAGIAMLSELSAARLTPLRAVALDGQPRTADEALAASGAERSVQALQGGALVQVTRTVVEDWSALRSTCSARLALESRGQPATALRPGASVALRATLEGGYAGGDVLWVCLPDAISWVTRGAQVKLFSVDFEGKNEVVVPLAATSPTVGPRGEVAAQSLRAVVRNAYREERAASPAPLAVVVASLDAG